MFHYIYKHIWAIMLPVACIFCGSHNLLAQSTPDTNLASAFLNPGKPLQGVPMLSWQRVSLGADVGKVLSMPAWYLFRRIYSRAQYFRFEAVAHYQINPVFYLGAYAGAQIHDYRLQIYDYYDNALNYSYQNSINNSLNTANIITKGGYLKFGGGLMVPIDPAFSLVAEVKAWQSFYQTEHTFNSELLSQHLISGQNRIEVAGNINYAYGHELTGGLKFGNINHRFNLLLTLSRRAFLGASAQQKAVTLPAQYQDPATRQIINFDANLIATPPYIPGFGISDDVPTSGHIGGSTATQPNFSGEVQYAFQVYLLINFWKK